MISRQAVAAAAVLLVGMMAAASAGADAIDDYVNGQLAAQKIPGVALLVMRHGAVVKAQGYGYANLELEVPVSAETLFQSGSCGKMFTAAGIELLAQDGRLRLDDPLARYYPDAPAAWHRITIRQLLAHTSGIKDYGEAEIDYRKDHTDEELLAAMQKLPIEFEPGTQWSYSNSGYVILGLLTTRLAGRHWSDFQSERIFKPLGMESAQVIDDRRITPNRAAGYQLDEQGKLVNQDWVSPSLNRLADGSLYFSLRDLVAWEKALEARSFMNAQAFTEWWTAAQLRNGSRYPHGFGWFLTEQRGQPVVMHPGSWQGFTSAIQRYPEQQLAVMVLTNSAQGDPEKIAREVAGLVDGQLRMRPPSSPEFSAGTARAAALRDVLEAWSQYRVSPTMAPSLAARNTGSAAEAYSRQTMWDQLRKARAWRIVGTDRLSKPAAALLADGTVSAVDAVLETDAAPVMFRFRMDGKDRVVDFSTFR